MDFLEWNRRKNNTNTDGPRNVLADPIINGTSGTKASDAETPKFLKWSRKKRAYAGSSALSATGKDSAVEGTYNQVPTVHNKTESQPSLLTLAQQVATARENLEQSQRTEKAAYTHYSNFLNRQTDVDSIDFLADGGKTSAAANAGGDALLREYQRAQRATQNAQDQFDALTADYTYQLDHAEQIRYQNMDLSELGAQLSTAEATVEASQAAAVASEAAYSSYFNQTDVDDLQMGSWTEAKEQQRQNLQKNWEADRAALDKAIETRDLILDTYTYRSDMQIISAMTDAEKLALQIYRNGRNVKETTELLKKLKPEQRKQLRATGRYFELLTNPEQYLKRAGYAKEDISRIAETYGRYLNELEMLQTQQIAQSVGDAIPVLGTISTYPAKLIGDVTGDLTALGSTIWHDLGLSNYKNIDVNLPGYAPMVYTDSLRGTVSDNIGGAGSELYDAFNSVMDDVAKHTAAKLTGVELLNYTGNLGQSVRQTAINGGNRSEGMSLGLAKIGLNVATDQIFPDSSLMNTAGAGMLNATQEEINYVGERLLEAAILDENSDFNRQVRTLVQAGVSEEDAKQRVKALYLREMKSLLASGLVAGNGKYQIDNSQKIS